MSTAPAGGGGDPTVLTAAGLVCLVVAVQLQIRVVEEPHLLTPWQDHYAAYAARAEQFRAARCRAIAHEVPWCLMGAGTTTLQAPPQRHRRRLVLVLVLTAVGGGRQVVDGLMSGSGTAGRCRAHAHRRHRRRDRPDRHRDRCPWPATNAHLPRLQRGEILAALANGVARRARRWDSSLGRGPQVERPTRRSPAA